MKRTLVSNDVFDKNVKDLIKRGNHASFEEVLIEALKRYDWILTETERGCEIVSIPSSPQPQPPKNKWNQNIRLVHSREDK